MEAIFIAVWIAFESRIFFIRTNRDLFIRIILFHMLDKSFRWLTDGQLFLAIAHPIDLDLDCELVIVR